MDDIFMSVKEVSHGYGDLTILDDVCFTLPKNKITALSAPSGAGKSTLLHILGFLERPNKGTVFIHNNHDKTDDNKTDKTIDGWAISDAKRTALRRNDIGFVFQFHYLLPEFNARENIMMPLRLNGHDKKTAFKQANDYLEKIGLLNRATHLPAELSGGEQQRIAIARALANRPKLILADEPTGNLDPATGGIIFDLFLNMVREHQASCLIVTHDQALAQKCDDRLTLLHGKII